MVKIKIFITFFSISLLIGCCPCKKLGSTKESVQRDSVSVKETTVIKDSLVYTDVDSAKIMAKVKCPDFTPVIKKNKIARVTFGIKDGIASADCFCDSSAIISRTTQKITMMFKEHLKEDKTATVTSVPFVPLLYKILSVIGLISLAWWFYKLYKFLK